MTRERIPVLRTEFGLLLRYHVPWVHARPGRKLVEIEPGNEALYPKAEEFEIVEPTPDDERRGIARRWRSAEPIEPFAPEPYEKVSIARPDVVVCPRKRRYGAAKNWGAWPNLVERLSSVGFSVFAAGSPEASPIGVGCPAAWTRDRYLDASIGALRKAKVAVATTSGLAVLAVLCGTPLVLVTYRGLIAPGAQLDPKGRAMQPSYEPAIGRVRKYLEPINHTGSPIRLVDGWENLDAVVEATELMADYSNRNAEGRLRASKSWDR